MRIFGRGVQGFVMGWCFLDALGKAMQAQTQVDYISVMRYDLDGIVLLALGAFVIYSVEIILHIDRK